MGDPLYTPGPPFEDWPSEDTLVTAAALNAIQAALAILGGGASVAVATTSQTFTDDQVPVQVVLASEETPASGSDFHFVSSSGGYYVIDKAGWYKGEASVCVTSAARGGDRNVVIQKTTGTITPSTDALVARKESTSNNSTTKDTGSWGCLMRRQYFAANTKLYLSFVQHARAGSGTATIGLGEDSSSPMPWLELRRVA